MLEELRRQILESSFSASVDEVESTKKDAEHKLAQAEGHLESASVICATDLEGALQLTYDAARKALQALMAAAGLRLRQPPGNHWTFVEISRLAIFDQEIWVDLKWMRERRNDSEYSNVGAPEITAREADEAMVAARLMLADVQRMFDAN